MKIQNDLVWDKNTGEIIGFLDLADKDLNNSTVQKVGKLASYVLVIMMRSVMNAMTYSLATFATDSILSYQIFPIFWRAVVTLELSCKLKVIAAVSDGASSNRPFFKNAQHF